MPLQLLTTTYSFWFWLIFVVNIWYSTIYCCLDKRQRWNLLTLTNNAGLSISSRVVGLTEERRVRLPFGVRDGCLGGCNESPSSVGKRRKGRDHVCIKSLVIRIVPGESDSAGQEIFGHAPNGDLSIVWVAPKRWNEGEKRWGSCRSWDRRKTKNKRMAGLWKALNVQLGFRNSSFVEEERQSLANIQICLYSPSWVAFIVTCLSNVVMLDIIMYNNNKYNHAVCSVQMLCSNMLRNDWSTFFVSEMAPFWMWTNFDVVNRNEEFGEILVQMWSKYTYTHSLSLTHACMHTHKYKCTCTHPTIHLHTCAHLFDQSHRWHNPNQ